MGLILRCHSNDQLLEEWVESISTMVWSILKVQDKYKPKAAAPSGTPKQQKPPSRFDQAANAAAVRTGANNAGKCIYNTP